MDAFGVIRAKQQANQSLKASDWKVTGPGHHAYKATDFQTDIDGSNRGTITFTLLRDNATTLTLVGAIEADGSNPITLDGDALPNPTMDAGFAVHPTSFIPPRFATSVIINFRYDDANEPGGRGLYRVEANVGSTHIPGFS